MAISFNCFSKWLISLESSQGQSLVCLLLRTRHDALEESMTSLDLALIYPLIWPLDTEWQVHISWVLLFSSSPRICATDFYELQHRYVKSCEGSEILPCLQASLPRCKRCWPKMWALQTGGLIAHSTVNSMTFTFTSVPREAHRGWAEPWWILCHGFV